MWSKPGLIPSLTSEHAASSTSLVLFFGWGGVLLLEAGSGKYSIELQKKCTPAQKKEFNGFSAHMVILSDISICAAETIGVAPRCYRFESHPFPSDLAFPAIQVTAQVRVTLCTAEAERCPPMCVHPTLCPGVVALMWQMQTHDSRPKINNTRRTEVWLRKTQALQQNNPQKYHPAAAAGCSAPDVIRAAESFKVVFLFLTSFQPSIMTPTRKKKAPFFIL